MPEDDLNYGVVHADLHGANFKIRGANSDQGIEESKDDTTVDVAFFDFDDIRVGYFLEDLTNFAGSILHYLGD